MTVHITGWWIFAAGFSAGAASMFGAVIVIGLAMGRRRKDR